VDGQRESKWKLKIVRLEITTKPKKERVVAGRPRQGGWWGGQGGGRWLRRGY
jgi:hypothetical protein